MPNYNLAYKVECFLYPSAAYANLFSIRQAHSCFLHSYLPSSGAFKRLRQQFLLGFDTTKKEADW